MKSLTVLLILLILQINSQAQTASNPQNIFIITTDGFRWQEIFGGADPALLADTRYVMDTALLKSLYGDSTPELRRKKLMPFFWGLLAEQGQLYGNRVYGNQVNVKNLFKISYPGYNEILTGYPDPVFIPNVALNNRNPNVLEYLNAQPAYAGKVVAFSSWNMFPFILNKGRSHLPVNSGYLGSQINGEDSTADLIAGMERDWPHQSNTRHDQLTFLRAKEYIGTRHPKLVLLSLGETDEFAHAGRYDLYLQQAAAFDKMVAELWYLVQTDPFYRNNTTFILTTDHGRGRRAGTWSRHGVFTTGSGQTWIALLGSGIAPRGEIRQAGQLWQNQFAATIAAWAGSHFETPRHIGQALTIPTSHPISGEALVSRQALTGNK